MNKQVIQSDKLSLEQARTRQLILVISIIGFAATTILTITSILVGNLTEIIINSVTALLLMISLVTAWFGSIDFGRAALPLTALISISYLGAVGNGINDSGILAFAIVISIAALLLGRRGLIVYGALSIAAILGIILAGSFGIYQHAPASVSDIIAVLMALIVSTMILYLNAQQLDQILRDTRHSEQVQIKINQELLETRDSLEKQAQELAKANNISSRRVEQLRLVAEVANSAASIQELERLLTTVTELFGQRFDVYHTGIFLLDDSSEYAILRAANSTGGRKMLDQGYRLKVGSQGIVGSVTATGNPRIALDVEMDSAPFDNPDLPDTRSEIALPLKIVGKTIGALDLQSVHPDAFSHDDIEVLSILADQVAIAIQNARSFESARRAAQDAETAYQQLTGETWSQFAKNLPALGYHYDGVEARSITVGTLEKNGAILQIPVRLRGKEIGKLKLTPLGSDRIWSDDEIAMAEAIAERAALSLENTRLLEEAQRRAVRESIIGKITSKISASTDMDTILRSAVSELGHQISGAKIALEITPEAESL